MLVPVDPSCLRTMTRVFLFAALVAVAGACYCDPTNGQQVSKFVKCMICDPKIHGTTACPRAGIMFVRHMHRYIDPVTKQECKPKKHTGPCIPDHTGYNKERGHKVRAHLPQRLCDGRHADRVPACPFPRCAVRLTPRSLAHSSRSPPLSCSTPATPAALAASARAATARSPHRRRPRHPCSWCPTRPWAAGG